MRRTTVRVDGRQLAEARIAPRPAAIAGAVVCAGVAVLVAATTVLVTFGLSEGYGFGPVWDLSAFVMTGGAAALTGTAVLGALRLARRRLPALRVLVFSVAAVFAAAYVAGIFGNSLHH